MFKQNIADFAAPPAQSIYCVTCQLSYELDVQLQSRSLVSPIIAHCLFSQQFDESLAKYSWFTRKYLMLQYRVRMLVEAPLFTNLFLWAIVGNTLILAMSYDGMSVE